MEQIIFGRKENKQNIPRLILVDLGDVPALLTRILRPLLKTKKAFDFRDTTIGIKTCSLFCFDLTTQCTNSQHL
jgi:hypothetical protein